METVNQDSAADAVDVGAAPAPASAGACLAAARVAKGLSVEDVSRQLKLSPAQVRALEAEDHASLPSPVFVRGFLRSYARMVGVDITALLPSKPVTAVAGPQGDRMLQQQSSTVMEARRKRPVFGALVILACVIAALSYYEFVINVPAPVPPAVPAAPAAIVVPVPVTPATVEPPAIPAAPDGARPAASESVSPAVPASEKSLHFVFKRDSWVEVLDGNDEVLWARRNAAGSEKQLTGKPPFKLVVGAASGVELRYDGKPVDLPAHAPTTDVARLTLE